MFQNRFTRCSKIRGMGLNDYYNLVTATSYSTLSMLHICIETGKLIGKRYIFIFLNKCTRFVQLQICWQLKSLQKMVNFEISSGNPILDENVENWLKWNIQDSKSYQDITQMVDAKRWKELEKIMVNRLAFGTAGLRGKMGPG